MILVCDLDKIFGDLEQLCHPVQWDYRDKLCNKPDVLILRVYFQSQAGVSSLRKNEPIGIVQLVTRQLN